MSNSTLYLNDFQLQYMYIFHDFFELSMERLHQFGKIRGRKKTRRCKLTASKITDEIYKQFEDRWKNERDHIN